MNPTVPQTRMRWYRVLRTLAFEEAFAPGLRAEWLLRAARGRVEVEGQPVLHRHDRSERKRVQRVDRQQRPEAVRRPEAQQRSGDAQEQHRQQPPRRLAEVRQEGDQRGREEDGDPLGRQDDADLGIAQPATAEIDREERQHRAHDREGEKILRSQAGHGGDGSGWRLAAGCWPESNLKIHRWASSILAIDPQIPNAKCGATMEGEAFGRARCALGVPYLNSRRFGSSGTAEAFGLHRGTTGFIN